MQDRTPDPATLDPVERVSVDELRALQLERLQWTLRHAYDNVPHYRQRVRRGRRAPRRLPRAGRPGAASRSPPRPTCATTTRSACSPCRASRCARIHASSRHDRPAHRRRLHRATTSTPGPTVMARSIRAAGGRPGDMVHIAYGYGLFTGGLGAHYGAETLGCTVIPVSGGMTERQVQLIRDFEPDDHHGDAVVHARDRRRDASGRASTRAATSLQVGIFGAEPWTERDARARSRSASTCTPSTSTGCPR